MNRGAERAGLFERERANGPSRWNVGEKVATARRAVAAGVVKMRADTAARLLRRDTPKGEVLATARIAGIMAAKRTPELIPLCHAVALTGVAIDVEVDAPGEHAGHAHAHRDDHG